jgi:enamine deaminase RidA (YjgF/YER057c/UK114 family)
MLPFRVRQRQGHEHGKAIDFIGFGSRGCRLFQAVVDGDWVFVASTAGFDYQYDHLRRSSQQTHQIFHTIGAVLEDAGSSLADVVKARYFVTDAAIWKVLAPVIGHYFKEIRPASTAIVCGLVDPRMKIEIEVTARRRS